jgi:osmotically inducible protein OsmC
MLTPLYTAHATVTGGRDGKGRTDDGKIDVTLHTPKEMGGAGGSGTNPEQLFAVGYAACFTGALKAVAKSQKLEVPADLSLTSHVTFNKDDTGFALSVELVGTFPGWTKESAEALMKAAHGVCPYSKATRGNIEVKLSVAQ